MRYFPKHQSLTYCLFFVSGMCGLIYQVMWTRMLTHVFGSTVFAVSTVLAAFMGGLALGSYYLGKRGDKADHPLKQYAYYEIGIGVAAVFVLLSLNVLVPVQVWLSDAFGRASMIFAIGRFVVVFALVLVPTILMGATLPILSRLMIAKLDRAGRTLSSLYVINTSGAVFGVLLAGFYLTGTLGTHNSVWMAAVLNILVGVSAWIMAKRWPFQAAEIATTTKAKNKKSKNKQSKRKGKQDLPILSSRARRLILIGFAISGVTSLSYEVLWTRSLVFYLGNSTYAFSTMLTAFLVGIAIGGYLIRFLVDRSKHPTRLFAWIQIGIGVTAAAAMPLFLKAVYSSWLQDWFGTVNSDWEMVIVMRFVVSLMVMLIPTILIGATFPLVGKLLLRGVDHAGEDVGRAYAVNAVGNIVGAMLPALALIPLLGIHRGILIMATANVAVGLVILCYTGGSRSRWRHLAPLTACGIAIGVFTLKPSAQYPSNTQGPEDEVLYYKEGMSATTKVYINHTTRAKHISVDGISIGGSYAGINDKQQWLAHLPKLLMNEYQTELSVGLGSGILIGESARHQKLEKITCVEIAPTVLEGARFFKEENDGILDSPRAEIIIDDGVNFLLTTSNKYDIISTDAKTQPEYGVNGVFFSKEYYTLMRDHLNPGGIAIQWIPLHYPPNVFQTIIKTCTSVFPHVQLWYVGRNFFIVASNHKVIIDTNSIAKKLKDPAQPFDGLRKLGITAPEELLSHFVAAEDVLREETKGSQINTIERPIVEFYDFRDYAAPETERMLANLEFVISMRNFGKGGDGIGAFSESVRAAYEAKGLYLEGYKLILSGGKKPDEIERKFIAAFATAPDNKSLRFQISEHYLQSAIDLIEAGKFNRAEQYARQSVELWPDSAEARYRYGFVLRKNGKLDLALPQYEAVVALQPGRVDLHRPISSYYLRKGKFDHAIPHLRMILKSKPEDVITLNNLGSVLAEKKEFREALKLLERAYKIAPTNADVIDSYAWVMYSSGNQAGARKIIQQGGGYYKKSAIHAKRRETMLR